MKNKIMEGLNYMDQRFIDEAVNAPKKLPVRKYWVRWIATAACLALMLSLGLLWYQRSREKIVLPPTRYAKGTTQFSLAREYTFDEAVEAADVVAWIRVGNWLSETTGDDTLDKTFFEAEVIQCFKGNPGKEIVLEQLGSSEATIQGYPLFTYGNELFVFLKYGAPTPRRPYENAYYINGTFSTVMDVTTIEDGKVYVTDRHGMIGRSVDSDLNMLKTAGLRDSLTKALSQVDSVQQSMVTAAGYIFAMDDLKTLLAAK